MAVLMTPTNKGAPYISRATTLIAPGIYRSYKGGALLEITIPPVAKPGVRDAD